MSTTPEPEENPVEKPEETGAPALWNPNAAINWSLLFTPAFGAYLHAKNCEAMNKKTEAADHRVWFYLFVLFYVGNTLLYIAKGKSVGPLGILLLLFWYFTTAKKHARQIKETYGDAYPRRDWEKPIDIGAFCLAARYGIPFAADLILARGNHA